MITTDVPQGDWLVSVPGRFADASIAFDAHLLGDTLNRFVEADCRRQEAPFGYHFLVLPTSGVFSLIRTDNGGEVTLVPRQSSTAIHRGTATNRIELKCAGSTISGAINGTAAFSVQDGTYADGRLTMGAGGVNVPFDARFDNLVVVQQ